MKKILILLAGLLLSSASLSAQSQTQNNIELKWSDQFTYDNKLDGFFDEFLGTSHSYAYAKFSNLAIKPKKQNNKVKLLVFDKATMKKQGEAELKGYSANYEELDYYKSIILEDYVYVIWTKEKKGTVEIFAESFDGRLKRRGKLTKVYELTKTKNGYDNLLVISNREVDNRIIVGKEFAATKDDENLRVEFKVLNADFTLISSKQVTLPLLVDKKRRGIFGTKNSFTSNVCTYEFGDDGSLYVQDMIRIPEEDRKSLKRGESSVYPHIMQINTETGDVQEYHIKFMKKNTFRSSYLITKKGIRVYGFFSDLDKDDKGRDTHGTYYISLDPKTFKPMDIKFSYFDKNFLDVLYAADKENQKKGKGLFKSKKDKASDEQSIDDNYVIERVIEDGNDIVLFCSIMRNWSRTVCTTSSNGATSCTTYYYCTKSNVTAFKLSSAGEIIWAKNLDRSITYNRWNVYDLSVIKDNDNYYVVYGSSFQMNAEKKNNRSSKSRKQMQDRFEYATFASSNGSFKKAEYNVNGFNTKKAEKKLVSPSDIVVFDNQMYTSCVRMKIKPATFISCLCPPVFYGLYFSGNSRKGTGYLGSIAPLK